MPHYEIFIPGPLPGQNEMMAAAKKKIPWLSGGKKKVFQYTVMKNEWTDKICIYFMKSKIPKMKAVAVEFVWLEKDRKRDPDNITAAKKFILDGMVVAGIIPNDGWKQVKGLSDSFAVSKDNPGVIVTVKRA